MFSLLHNSMASPLPATLRVSRYHCDTHDRPVIRMEQVSSSTIDPATNARGSSPPTSCKDKAKGCRMRHVVTDSSLVHVSGDGTVTHTPA